MFTARKRHLRKKRLFLQKKKFFALFNASNLKTSKITEIRLTLQNAKLYSVPLYLNPPKLGLGYPLFMVVYDTLEDFKQNVPEIATKLDCLGISIDEKWYSIEIFQKENINNLNKNLLSLFISKAKNLKILNS